MINTKLKATFEKIQRVRLEGTFGATEWEEVNITYNVDFNMLKQYGSFEIYSDDGEYYTEGGLWFKNGELTGYVGIFSLPIEILEQLEKWGLNCKDMIKSLSK